MTSLFNPRGKHHQSHRGNTREESVSLCSFVEAQGVPSLVKSGDSVKKGTKLKKKREDEYNRPTHINRHPQNFTVGLQPLNDSLNRKGGREILSSSTRWKGKKRREWLELGRGESSRKTAGFLPDSPGGWGLNLCLKEDMLKSSDDFILSSKKKESGFVGRVRVE